MRRLNLQTLTPVTSLQKSNDGQEGSLLRTSRGSVLARRVLLATNGYTSHLLPQFSTLISPLQAQMSALVPSPTSPFAKHLIPKSYGFVGIGDMDRVMSDYLVQNLIRGDSQGGHLMFGGGRQKVPGHGVGVSDDSYVDHQAEMYLRSLPERLDLATHSEASQSSTPNAQLLDIAGSWTGIIGSSADGHPWVGRVPDYPGLYLSSGYSGHGMTNAGLCGRYAAKLVLLDISGEQKRGEMRGTADGQSREDGYSVPKEYILTKQRMEAVLGGTKKR